MKKKELIKKLQDEVKFYKDLADDTSKLAIDTINKQHKQHERQIQVAEKEIQRLNVIINFLYMKGRE